MLIVPSLQYFWGIPDFNILYTSAQVYPVKSNKNRASQPFGNWHFQQLFYYSVGYKNGGVYRFNIEVEPVNPAVFVCRKKKQKELKNDFKH